MNKQATIYI